MEFLCFLFVTIGVIAAKAATKAAKTSGAARGLWIAKKKGILERLREQEGAVVQHTEDLRDRASRFEPPPPPQDVLDEAERALKSWGADPAMVIEELPELEPVFEVLPEPVVVAPDPVVAPAPAPEIQVQPEPVLEPVIEPEPVLEPVPALEPVPEPAPVIEPVLADLEPFVEVEEEFFDPLIDPSAAAFGGGLGVVALGAAALSPEDVPAAPGSDQLGGAELLALVDDLFESGRPGFEVKELFEGEHLGRTVRWRAVIDRIEPFQRDELLQDGPGVRIVTEYQPEDSSARRVRVDIGVDSETAALLERGKGLAFVGELSSCDPYLHSFTLRDARLV